MLISPRIERAGNGPAGLKENPSSATLRQKNQRPHGHCRLAGGNGLCSGLWRGGDGRTRAGAHGHSRASTSGHAHAPAHHRAPAHGHCRSPAYGYCLSSASGHANATTHLGTPAHVHSRAGAYLHPGTETHTHRRTRPKPGGPGPERGDPQSGSDERRLQGRSRLRGGFHG